MSENVNEIIDILEKAEKKTARTRKPRTKNTEKPKKAKKLTKKEQQILDIEASIEMPDNYILINTVELLDKLTNYYKAYKTMYAGDSFVFIDTETYGLNNWKDKLISISIGFMSEQYFNIPMTPFLHERSRHIPTLPFDMVADILRPILEAERKLVLANAKFDVHVLYNWAKIDITFNVYWDTFIAGGLLNENKPKGLKEWFNNYALPNMISKGIVSREEYNRPTFKFGSMFDKIPFDSIPERLATYYAAHDVYMTHRVFLYQKEIMESPVYGLEGVYKLFREVEMPLMPVFATAERRGVELDSKFLTDIIGRVLSEKLSDILNGYTNEKDEYVKGIYDYIGKDIVVTETKTRQKDGIKYKVYNDVVKPLNLGSPSQVAAKLYDDFKILEPQLEYDKVEKKKVPKKSTSKKVLTRNKKVHPVIPLILEYRGMSKLIDAFCNKLPTNVVDNIIHGSYNQMVRTGRVSMSMPNLQQVPSKFDLIRYAFRAAKNRLLVSADFSQQELRWLAIMTKEQALIDVFVKGLDMHSQVTCQIHGLFYDMFEQIRNYKGESEAETQESIKQAIDTWKYTKELEYAIKYMAAKSPINHSIDNVTADTITDLASFFELNRKKTKSVVFGVVYGITELGLSDQIEDTKENAKALIDGFKAGLPNYLVWEAQTHREVMQLGYIETVLGRKRRFRETLDEAMQSDSWKRNKWDYRVERCKRQSCNAKIQGSSADQSKKAMVALFYPKRPDGTICLDRDEWLREGYVSQLDAIDTHIVLQVHDELIFDAPSTVDPAALQEIATTMCNVIPNDVGVSFRSDVEVSPYWGGNFSQEQVRQMNDGTLNWKEIFEQEVKKKLNKFGIEYEIGMFENVKDGEEDDDDEDVEDVA